MAEPLCDLRHAEPRPAAARPHRLQFALCGTASAPRGLRAGAARHGRPTLRPLPARATAAAIAALDDAYPWDPLLAALKFHDGLELLPWATATLVAAIGSGQGGGLSAVELVLPVPLAGPRLRERRDNE